MGKEKNVSFYLSFLLRHGPERLELQMDRHGWVSVQELLRAINHEGKYRLTMEGLEEIVAFDSKGRYRFDDKKTKIKACQGHSIPWVEPELEFLPPPDYLYHGTTTAALKKIEVSGHISKMKRHAVHTQEDFHKAWQSASRWQDARPVVLKIDASKMYQDGYQIGRSDNNVWCIEQVPLKYIVERIYQEEPFSEEA